MTITASDIRESISYPHDGEVNDFVMISRALELVRDDNADVEDVANILHDLLNEHGWLAPDGYVLQSRS